MAPLIEELQQTLARTSDSRHVAMLSGVADLFVAGATTYSPDHVAIFDDVISHLIENIKHPALIELSRKLALVGNAPTRVIHRLACDDDIAVSGPVLEHSEALADDSLIEIANTKSQHHLAAICGRPHISEPVTNALIERGIAEITVKVLSNEGARLSDTGFAKLINRAGANKDLAAALARRKDLPSELRPFLGMALA